LGFFSIISNLDFQDEITAFSIGPKGEYIAVALKQILGIYKSNQSGQMTYVGSYFLNDIQSVITNIVFHESGEYILIKLDTGLTKELYIFERENGMLLEKNS
jgi:hypothetical protein